MIHNLASVRGLDKAAVPKLAENGINSPQELLEACGKKAGRAALAKQTGLNEKDLLEWCNRVDLSRVTGIGVQWSNLLEVTGVDTVPELAQRNAANLQKAMDEKNTALGLLQNGLPVPTLAQVENWVAQAKELPRMIHY